MLRRIAATLGLILATGMVLATPASAAHPSTIAGPQLVCQVSNGTTGAGRCGTGTPQNPYTVLFTLTSVAPGGVTQWDLPPLNAHAYRIDPRHTGCGQGQLQCMLTVYPTQLAEDVVFTVTVHYRTTSIIVYQSSATVTAPGRCPYKC